MIFKLTRYYSDEDKKKSDLGSNALTYGLSGLGAGGAALAADTFDRLRNKKLIEKITKLDSNLRKSPEDRELWGKLNDKINSIDELHHTRRLNSDQSAFSRFNEKELREHLIKECKKSGIDNPPEDYIKKAIDDYKQEKFGGKPYKIAEGRNASAAVVAHEFGHYNIEKDRAGLLPKITQRAGHKDIFRVGRDGKDSTGKIAARVGMHMIPGVATGATGFKVDEDTGDVKLRKASLIAPALGIALPFVRTHHEKVASKEAMKLLKGLGASDKYLNQSKESLKAAYNTYASNRNLDIAANTAASGLGYLASGLRAKRKGDRIKEEKERRREERNKFLDYKEGE
jgi:hypothetical protein